MYLTAYIERLGTGTTDIIKEAKTTGLREPDFEQNDDFRIVLYRPYSNGNISSTQEDTMEDTMEVTVEVKRLISVMNGEMKRAEIQSLLGLKNNDNFRLKYVLPALEAKIIEMTIPDKPKSSKQKYRLTSIGQKLK